MADIKVNFRMKCREYHEYHRHIIRRMGDKQDTDEAIAFRAHCKGDKMSIHQNGSKYSGCGKFYTVRIPRSAYPFIIRDPSFLEDILKSQAHTNNGARRG